MQNIYRSKKIAVLYHCHRLQTNFRLYKHWLEISVLNRYLGVLKSPVLDVGSGTGRISEYLLSKGYFVVCLDDSPAMLSELKKRLRPVYKNLTMVKASILDIPFKKHYFPVVVSFRVLWHLSADGLAKALQEVTRVALKYIIFDITNDRYQKSLFYTVYWRFFRNSTENSRYLNRNKVLVAMKALNFTLVKGHNVAGIPHLWLNLWPGKNPYLLFKIARIFDTLLSCVLPPQRELLVFKRDVL